MTEIGTIKRGNNIGYKDNAQYIWLRCFCGNERWVEFRRKDKYKHCIKCNGGNTMKKGNAHHSWKGGRHKQKNGYVYIKLMQDDFFYSMANPLGYVFEHRLEMAKNLGRCLHPWEIVHHKNGIRDDNQIENLELHSDLGHKGIHQIEQKISILENRITLLEAENILLKKQIKVKSWQEIKEIVGGG